MPTATDARHPVLENAELLLAIGTGAVGLLFVLGLLVSNVQLMELGISDFASLQTRNVMIGFLFVIYVLLFLLGISPILILPFLIQIIVAPSTPRKTLAIIVFALPCLLIPFIAVYWAGILIGYYYPWGRPWGIEYDSYWSWSHWSWSGYTKDFVTAWRQFIEAYWHAKIITAACLWLVTCCLWASGVVRSSVAYLLLALGVPLLLFTYADEVYPNLKYNLGGGQPQIVELEIGGEKTVVTDLPGIVPPIKKSDDEQIFRTSAVAIWYQSDKFLYFSNLPGTEQSAGRVTAIDLKMVKGIRYLAKYTRVASGGRIQSVHSY